MGPQQLAAEKQGSWELQVTDDCKERPPCLLTRNMLGAHSIPMHLSTHLAPPVNALQQHP
jgi:hypothetical protein